MVSSTYARIYTQVYLTYLYTQDQMHSNARCTFITHVEQFIQIIFWTKAWWCPGSMDMHLDGIRISRFYVNYISVFVLEFKGLDSEWICAYVAPCVTLWVHVNGRPLAASSRGIRHVVDQAGHTHTHTHTHTRTHTRTPCFCLPALVFEHFICLFLSLSVSCACGYFHVSARLNSWLFSIQEQVARLERGQLEAEATKMLWDGTNFSVHFHWQDIL